MEEAEVRRVAMVTGGGQGIGRGIAHRLVSEGWFVAVVDVDAEAAEEVAAELGGAVLAVVADVADEFAVEAAVRMIAARFGRIDALVNNAAVSRAYSGPLENLDLADWNRVVAVNLTGPLVCTKHAAPYLRRVGGAVVNIASTRAFQSEPNSEAYAASKGGLVALTHALAASLGPEIRVNCVSPGWIAVEDWKKRAAWSEPVLRPEDHAQHFAGRVGRPDDIASMVSFLVSEQSGFVTGQNFTVDGGMTRKMIYLE